MKKIYIIPMLAAGLLATGCSKDNPFEGEGNTGEGRVLKSALDLSKAGDDIIINTKAGADEVDLDNFQVSFVKDGGSVAYKTYKYGEMPEVVVLPAASYRAVASYGENRDAEWENPYYTGESGEFEVKTNEITSYIDPIECELKNVKVTIEFDPLLKQSMSEDSYVEVRVGQTGFLNYTLAETETGKAGYFKYTAENTLVATFIGTVDGSKISATKSYIDVKGGCWYKLTFRLHNGDVEGSGDVDGKVSVDASVTTEDVNANVTINEDEPMDDSERPEWGGEPGGEDPKTEGPEILAITKDMVFDKPWNVTFDRTDCKLKFVSHADTGFQVLTCEIISDELNPENLAVVGLESVLDLATTPDSYKEALINLKLPVDMKGQTYAEFDLKDFFPLLSAFGNTRHEFKVHIEDANGEVTKSLILQF